jgi:chromosomal replication initiation ATPase DnaA
MGFAVSASFTERGIAARHAALKTERFVEAKERVVAKWFHQANQACEIVVGKPRGQMIMEEIAARHGFTIADLKGVRRHPPLIVARHHAMYEVARQCKNLSIVKIGLMFRRDHTTLLAALRRWPEKAARHGISCMPMDGRS